MSRRKGRRWRGDEKLHHEGTKSTKEKKKMELDLKRERANQLSKVIIGAAIEVHRHLGPGLLESAYEACLCRELALRGIPFDRQLALPVVYKGLEIDCAYRLDVKVGAQLILELKSVEKLDSIHEAQLLTYLRLSHVW